MMTPKSGVFLLGSCIAAIAAVGSIFELASGTPDLGNSTTAIVLIASVPLTIFFFWIAVQDSRANLK
ncbi:MAG: hypothetical protein SAL07_18580 [Oscillatoria sp. PMC 1051.18]|uniref:hypothetical protein n=1 Tax=Oscillatoria salina TaxID=331517 RepID=UPI001CC9C85E|nr:hypothetical protein [Oscillatoria salina]MEC4892129.1 hypothetical protein [Oscillatoria sp. PMC 1050.18]MEC5031910.1 hypothetical protein [Oscillatoria sp. PMC 1051.18]